MRKVSLPGLLLCFVLLAAAACWADTITSHLGHQGLAFAPGMMPSTLGWGPDDKPYPDKFVVNPTDGSEMAWVPPGEFMMGSPAREGDPDEHPWHKVRITKGFWIGKYDVTNEQYARFLTANGGIRDAEGYHLIDRWASACGLELVGNEYRPKAGRARHPVVELSWYGAKAYCEKYGFVLPTEAQWEYAARGPEGREFPWGNHWDPMNCCNSDNKGAGEPPTMEVGSIPAGDSWCGASDMAGNVWQWCGDWYDESYYGKSPGDDPPGPAGATVRLLRGGSWAINPRYCRSAVRGWKDPVNWSYHLGFRVARTP